MPAVREELGSFELVPASADAIVQPSKDIFTNERLFFGGVHV